MTETTRRRRKFDAARIHKFCAYAAFGVTTPIGQHYRVDLADKTALIFSKPYKRMADMYVSKGPYAVRFSIYDDDEVERVVQRVREQFAEQPTLVRAAYWFIGPTETSRP